jgi:putative hydrolase of the HAD superfamily
MIHRPCTPKLVIFDAFTLVHPVSGFESTFTAALTTLGVAATDSVMSMLQSASEGLDHTRWSKSRKDYSTWTRRTLNAAASELLDGLAPHVIPALEERHQAPMEAFSDVRDCLGVLRSEGISIGVCSNWGWDLARDLAGAGLADLINVTISSAQAGYRKPHQAIYHAVLDAARVAAAEAVFVGDSIRADVLGPRDVGIYSVHLDRASTGSDGCPAVSSLSHLFRHLKL